jgi:hypothetical protein
VVTRQGELIAAVLEVLAQAGVQPFELEEAVS